MKTLITALLVLTALELSAFTIDLGQGYAGRSGRYYLQTLKEGERVVVDLPRNGTYVESVTIAAIGKQRAYSFGKVFADGVEIATLGVPGRDPIYPIVVRGHVKTLEVVATAGSKFKITDFKIFTQKKNYQSYQSRRGYALREYSLSSWGVDVLDLVAEFDYLFRTNSGEARELFFDLKKIAMKVEASDRVRDERSLKTFKRAKILVEKITLVEEYLYSIDLFFLNTTADLLITDLLTIKEDIAERYDLEL